MFDIIDPYIPVSWCLQFHDGGRWFDTNIDQRAWITAKNIIQKEKLIIRRMHLFSQHNILGPTTFNGVLTPEYCNGYFFSKKIIADFTGGNNHLYAIGHFDNETKTVDIRWYNEHMSLVQREHRPIDRATTGYINNTLNK